MIAYYAVKRPESDWPSRALLSLELSGLRAPQLSHQRDWTVSLLLLTGHCPHQLSDGVDDESVPVPRSPTWQKCQSFYILTWLCISDIKYSNILSVHFRQKTYQFSISELTGLSGYWTESRELLHHQRTAGWGFNWIVGTGTQTSYCCSQGTWPTSYAALPAALQTTHCNCTQTRHGQFYADQTDRYHIKARMLHCSAD